MTIAEADPTLDRAARIRAILVRDFTPAHLTIEDDSAKHASHAGARAGGQTHYTVSLVSDRFQGVGRVERSRMVHGALSEEFASGLHALALRLRAPQETKS